MTAREATSSWVSCLTKSFTSAVPELADLLLQVAQARNLLRVLRAAKNRIGDSGPQESGAWQRARHLTPD